MRVPSVDLFPRQFLTCVRVELAMLRRIVHHVSVRAPARIESIRSLELDVLVEKVPRMADQPFPELVPRAFPLCKIRRKVDWEIFEYWNPQHPGPRLALALALRPRPAMRRNRSAHGEKFLRRLTALAGICSFRGYFQAKDLCHRVSVVSHRHQIELLVIRDISFCPAVIVRIDEVKPQLFAGERVNAVARNSRPVYLLAVFLVRGDCVKGTLDSDVVVPKMFGFCTDPVVVGSLGLDALEIGRKRVFIHTIPFRTPRCPDISGTG